ncbi:MAG: hypothetical protein J5911_01430 [Clostridia bacterium]|nr:hypothetical protein [Clostridia bacterium]
MDKNKRIRNKYSSEWVNNYYADMQKIYGKNAPRAVKVQYNVYEPVIDYGIKSGVKYYRNYGFRPLRWKLKETIETYGVKCGGIVYLRGFCLHGLELIFPTYRIINSDCTVIERYATITNEFSDDLKLLYDILNARRFNRSFGGFTRALEDVDEKELFSL